MSDAANFFFLAGSSLRAIPLKPSGGNCAVLPYDSMAFFRAYWDGVSPMVRLNRRVK